MISVYAKIDYTMNSFLKTILLHYTTDLSASNSPYTVMEGTLTLGPCLPG